MYTISHRQASVVRADVQGLLRHDFRDVDRSQGAEVSHANERIIAERTALNQSRMWVNGQEQAVESNQQIVDELDRRISTAGGTRVNKKTGKETKVAVRKDAGVVREIVLQLDPHFTGSSADLLNDQEHLATVEKYMEAMVDYYADIYGRDNLLAASTHYDETSPHMHLLVTPIDEKGRVRNASFIADGRGKSGGMSKNDKAMRNYIKDVGYDVDPEPTGARRSHMRQDDYAAMMKEQEAAEARIAELQAEAEAQLEEAAAIRRKAARMHQEALEELESTEVAKNELQAVRSSFADELEAAEQYSTSLRELKGLIQSESAHLEGLRVGQGEMTGLKALKSWADERVITKKGRTVTQLFQLEAGQEVSKPAKSGLSSQEAFERAQRDAANRQDQYQRQRDRNSGYSFGN